MADVKWIKLMTDMFDNRKIRQIECLPEGDAIIVIWVKLLCLAGIINDSGMVYLTKEIPYTEQMLAAQFGRPLTTVQLSLGVLQQFGMIEVIDDILKISNWSEYQNVEGMDKIREQTRKRVAKHRENKKLPACNDEGNVTVTQCNATEEERRKKKEDKDIDIDKDKEIESDASSPAPKPKRQSKHTHGEYKNVLLTDDELSKLTSEYGESMTGELIVFLDEYIEMKGYKAKSHYLAIKKWVVDAVNERREKKNRSGTYTLSNGVETSNPFIADIDAIEHELF